MALGPRPVGTAANAAAATLLVQRLEALRNSSKVHCLFLLFPLSLTCVQCAGRLRHYVRREPGNTTHTSVLLSQLEMPLPVTYWQSIDNVVAVLEGTASSADARESFLISSHYDSVTLSVGAYDDTAGVAVAMEVLTVLCAMGT